MLSGAIDGRLSRYPMFHQVCSLTVQNKTGTGILKLGEPFCDGLRHTEGSSWYLKKDKRRRCWEERKIGGRHPRTRRTSKDLQILPEPHLDITSSRHHFTSLAPRSIGVAYLTLWQPSISSSILNIVTPGLFYSHQQR